MNELIKNDFQLIVNYCLKNVELLIGEMVEFYPFGAKLELNKSISNVNTFDGDDFPLSKTLIDKLRSVFKKDFEKQKCLVTAITYDVLAIDPHDQVKKDAIAIRVQHKDLIEPRIFYFPYKIVDNQLVFSKSWGELE